MSRLHLGLDASTQSLTAVIIDLDTLGVVYRRALNFDTALPHYHTRDGVLRLDDPAVVHAPPRMWAEALDLLFTAMQTDRAPLDALRSIAVSGQQHGSVYLNDRAPDRLATLDPTRPLAEQLDGLFSRPTSPVWMDHSTAPACRAIEAALGGRAPLLHATGSAATERFTGPQIHAFAERDPDGYRATAHIALVSSFMTSLIAGRIAPIDPGDGAGMNLMDIHRFTWHPDALRATAPHLAERLPPIAPSGAVLGPVAPYLVRRYAINPQAVAAIGSGDNPCSVVGLGLVHPGQVAISMGTSYTYFGTMDQSHVDPDGLGHVFGSPCGGYLTLNCFKNGGLARARVRDRYGLDWSGYRAAMHRTPPGNHGRLMLPWFEPEIIPNIATPGVRRLGLDEQDADGNCRALVEAQALAMRRHADWMETRPTAITVTGGASEDPTVLQVLADVFQCPVQPSALTDGAATGAALLAARPFLDEAEWKDTITAFTAHGRPAPIPPDPATAPVYDALLTAYAAFEAQQARA